MHDGFSGNIIGCGDSFGYFICTTHDAQKSLANADAADSGDFAQAADSNCGFRDLPGHRCRIFAALAKRFDHFSIRRRGPGVTGLAVVLGVSKGSSLLLTLSWLIFFLLGPFLHLAIHNRCVKNYPNKWLQTNLSLL
jgi:hypothetical protein